MKSQLRVAAAQFQHTDGDKRANLDAIRRLTRAAAERGAQAVCFHECCVTGYTFLRRLDRNGMKALAEPVPDGPSTQALIAIAREHNIHVLATLVELEGDKLYKACVCVNGGGLVARFRKLHPFINPHLLPGSEVAFFKIHDWTCSILICYDNNLPENPRMAALGGAEILFMPHVTMGLPGPEPGLGFFDPKLWENRERDPASLRRVFDGPSGREWLLKWLPCRAYENGFYAVFTNPVGRDDDQIRSGGSMIVDPHGRIAAECRSFGEELAVAVCHPELVENNLGRKFLQARRPGLYGPLVVKGDAPPVTRVGWM